MSEIDPGGAGPHDSLEALLDVAERYFVRQESKVQIAAELQISRFRVARMIRRCLDEGIVQISIRRPSGPGSELAAQLRARYDLDHVAVVDVGRSAQERSLREQLGAAAAALLQEVVTPEDVLGVGWGRTIKAVAESVTSLPRCAVVQLGGMAGSPGENSMELVRRLAAVSHGPAYPIYAPLLVSDAATAATLRSQPGLEATFTRHQDVTVAIVAVGSWDPPNSQLRAAFSERERLQLSAAGVRAEVCAVLLDSAGNAVAPEVSARTLAVTSDGLRRIPTVIAVAGGASKTMAIRSVLLGRYATSLVTDTGVARALLDMESLPDPLT